MKKASLRVFDLEFSAQTSPETKQTVTEALSSLINNPVFFLLNKGAVFSADTHINLATGAGYKEEKKIALSSCASLAFYSKKTKRRRSHKNEKGIKNLFKMLQIKTKKF